MGLQYHKRFHNRSKGTITKQMAKFLLEKRYQMVFDIITYYHTSNEKGAICDNDIKNAFKMPQNTCF